MRRCLVLSVFASMAAWGQEQPPIELPKLDPGRTSALANARGGWYVVYALPDGVARLEARARERVCSVPLLVVPVNPNVDPNMPIFRPPKSNGDRMPIIQGLPPCRDDRWK